MKGRLILAGADGYIGSRIRQSLADQTDMILLSPTMSGEYIHFDLLHPGKFDFNIINPEDTVLMLAGISSPDICSREFRRSFETNVRGTILFVSECLQRGAKVLFFSSDTVYGYSKGVNDEDFLAVTPAGEYGIMKLLIENYFRGETQFKAFRLSYVFSWFDKFTSYLRSCMRENITAEVFDPLIRKAVYIEDLILCILNLHTNWERHNSQLFNLCGPGYLSRVDLANIFIKHVGQIKLKIIRPDESFYNARPPMITMNTKYSEALLGKGFTTIEEAIVSEKLKFLN